MDFDLIVKAVVAMFGASAPAKLIYEWMNSSRGRMREDFNFARTFLKDVAADPGMHPYLIETGYQAIAGTRRITANEVRCVLGLAPITAISDYVFARMLLQFNKSPGVPFEFRSRYRDARRRRRLKQLYLVLYSLTALTPIWLWILVALHLVPPGKGLLLSALLALGFWPAAYLALRAGVRISRAEEIVERAADLRPAMPEACLTAPDSQLPTVA